MQQPSGRVTTAEESSAGSGNRSGRIDEETIYSIVASERPRYVLHYLKRRDEPVTIGELAEQVAAWENDVEPAAVSSTERKRVYVALYQSHLPTLDERGLVVYDDERGVVEVSEAIRHRRIYLEVVPRYDIPWSRYYLGLTIAGALAIGLAWFGVAPFDSVPEMAFAVAVLVAFGGSALYQTRSTSSRELGDEGSPVRSFPARGTDGN